MTMLSLLAVAACGGSDSPTSPTPVPPPPNPPPIQVTATAYILPNAANLGPNAFGDHEVLIFKGERLRWFNLDQSVHALVADTPNLPEFRQTNTLAPGSEQSFEMNTAGRTTFHCTIHPEMVGTLEVRER